MRYKTIEKQNEEFISILKQNKDIMSILDYLSKIKLPNFYIASGSVFQTIWNHLDNKPLNHNIKDIDIVYFDTDNLSQEYETDLENQIINYLKSINLNYEIDIHNEARMHLWKKDNENKNIDKYQNSEEAIEKWIATVQAVGITKENDTIKIFAPYGLSDIFSKTIRPIKHTTNSKELYTKKIESWKKRFDNLNIIEW